tara:strand:- start:193 stop:648 length:456 start_codon:yes stop_codon:yes gene_type:complete
MCNCLLKENPDLYSFHVHFPLSAALLLPHAFRTQEGFLYTIDPLTHHIIILVKKEHSKLAFSELKKKNNKPEANLLCKKRKRVSESGNADSNDLQRQCSEEGEEERNREAENEDHVKEKWGEEELTLYSSFEIHCVLSRGVKKIEGKLLYR